MKKLGILMVILFLVTGCGTKEKKLDLSQIREEVSKLSLSSLDYDNLVHRVEDDLTKMDTLTKEQIEEQIGIDDDFYEHAVMRVSKETGASFEVYLVIQPKENKTVVIKDKVNSYFQNLVLSAKDEEEKKNYENRVEIEYDGNLIYVLSKNANEMVDKIKDSHELVFPNMMKLSGDEMKEMIGIAASDLEESEIHISKTLDSALLLMIIKPKKDHQTEVETKVNEYFKKLEKEWKVLDDKEYQLVENRMSTRIDDYQIYIISKDNEKVLNMIKSHYE